MRLAPSLLLLLIGCDKSSIKLEDTGKDGTPDPTGDTTESQVDGSIAVTPADIDFGVVFVGATGDADITVRNVGEGDVSVTLQVVGGWATDYTLNAYTASPAPGAETTHTLHVAPTEWGDHSVSIVVDDAMSGGHVEIPVHTLVQVDADGDGYGSTMTGGQDCNDEDATVNPGAAETWYDGIDADCAGDDDYDQDADGVEVADDCNDEDATVYPGADDAWYDGVDADCAGNDDDDQDADGYPLESDCDDTDPTVNPGATEVWYDGIDSDCAGDADDDQDADGFPVDTDCDDTDAAVHPGAADAWYDGVDADCAGNDDFDQDGDGVTVATDCNDTDPTTTGPTDEVIDGVDNDCDGSVDNVSIDSLSTGVVWGDVSSAGLGDKGTFSLDADVDGDGVSDLVATADGSGYGDAWLVPAASFAAAAGSIDGVDSATGAGSRGYAPAFVATPALDTTGDGAAELVLNYSSEGSYYYGYTYVWDGAGTTGTLNGDDALYTFTGDSTDDCLMAGGMGDVDGDGVVDFVTGSPYDNNSSSSDTGNLAIFDGASLARGLAIDDATQIHGTSSYDYLGHHIALADLTGDGLADIIAGAQGDDDGGSGAGAVYVIAGTSGSFGSTADTAAWAKITGAANNDAIGEDPIPMPGDVDGDGLLDLGFASEDEGAVWVFLGSALVSGTTSASAASHILSGTAGDFGSALQMDTDLDGDGADEIAVGADGSDANGANSGEVYLYRWESGWGASLGVGDAFASIYGGTAGDYLGTGLGGGGDVTGDGIEDLALGAVAVDAGGSDAGAIYLVPGW